MQRDPVEIQFHAQCPWRTLRNPYWPERRWIGIALLSYLFQASPVWIPPVITAHIIDRVAARCRGILFCDPGVRFLNEATRSPGNAHSDDPFPVVNVQTAAQPVAAAKIPSAAP
jgi:hypothetical protein